MIPVWLLFPTVSVTPGLYTAADLATRLSPEFGKISVHSELADRFYLVSLTRKPKDSIPSLLREGIGIDLRQKDEAWEMEPNPATESRNARLFSAYCREMDRSISEVFARVRALSPHQFPPDPVVLRGEAAARLGQSRQTSWRTLLEPLDTVDKRAYALLLSMGTSDEGSYNISGPLFYYFAGGGSIRKLIPGDQVDFGNAFYWRDRKDLPEFVRTRATVFAKQAEAALTTKGQEREADVERIGQEVTVNHRLRFSPLLGQPAYSYSVVKSLRIPGGWWASQGIRALHVDQGYGFLEAIHEEAGLLSALKERKEATLAYLESELGKLTVSVERPGARFSSSLLGWSSKHRQDILMDVSSVRDFGLLNSIGSLEQLAPWLGRKRVPLPNEPEGNGTRERAPGSPDSALWAPESWSLRVVDGVTVVHNEFGFLDRKYSASLAALGAWTRDHPTPTIAQLYNLSKVIPQRQANLAARSLWAPFYGDHVRAFPWLRLLYSLPASKRDGVIGKLGIEPFSFPMKEFGKPAVVRFAQEIQALQLPAGPSAIDPPFMQDAPLHPGWFDTVMGSSLTFQPRRGEEGVLDMYVALPSTTPVYHESPMPTYILLHQALTPIKL